MFCCLLSDDDLHYGHSLREQGVGIPRKGCPFRWAPPLDMSFLEEFSCVAYFFDVSTNSLIPWHSRVVGGIVRRAYPFSYTCWPYHIPGLSHRIGSIFRFPSCTGLWTNPSSRKFPSLTSLPLKSKSRDMANVNSRRQSKHAIVTKTRSS
jgi:hypothetical protein